MLKAGVRAAMDCAVEGSRGLLDGAEPGRFVSGLAHDLGKRTKRKLEVSFLLRGAGNWCRAVAVVWQTAGWRAAVWLAGGTGSLAEVTSLCACRPATAAAPAAAAAACRRARPACRGDHAQRGGAGLPFAAGGGRGGLPGGRSAGGDHVCAVSVPLAQPGWRGRGVKFCRRRSQGVGMPCWLLLA